MPYREDPLIEELEISDYRSDAMLVDSSFLGIGGSSDGSLISQLKELIDSSPEIKSILARLKQRQSNRVDSVQYRTDNQDSMYRTKTDFPVDVQQKHADKSDLFWEHFIKIANDSASKFSTDSSEVSEKTDGKWMSEALLAQIEMAKGSSEVDSRKDSNSTHGGANYSLQSASGRNKKPISLIMARRLERSKRPAGVTYDHFKSN